MTKVKLLGSDSEEESGADAILSINKCYANRYDNWRRLEEIQKIKDRYGDQASDSSSSDEELEWNAADEMRFLQTLSALKEGDASIYDEKSHFWSHSEQKQISRRTRSKKQQESPMYIKDYERKMILDNQGDIDESDEDCHREDPNYFDKQEQIRNELRKAVQIHDGCDGDENSDDFLIPKMKSAEEKELEEQDFYSWIKSHENKDVSENDVLKGLKKAWRDPDIEEGEKFLRDYLVNQEFIPSENDQLVTFDDIRELEEDEKDLDKQLNFEHKYNFRFEDPDQEFIKQYPRTVGDSLRKSNSRRKEKREEYKERKEKEKRERKQEIREMKRIKRAEIERKLERLKKMAGDDIPLNIDDLVGDFDPKEYDKRMAQVFNDEYYGKGDAAAEENTTDFIYGDMDDVESDSSDYDNFCVLSAHSAFNNDNTTVVNCKSGIDEPSHGGMHLRTRNGSCRKRKRNSKLQEVLHRNKPLFNPNEKTFEEYFNEYYALDYEDIIGDQLTRFKYRQVVPNDFGLSVGEILSADDRQLNAWASLKKATGYRSEHEEMVDVKRYRKKAADVKKKRRIFSTDFGGKKSRKQIDQRRVNNEMDQLNKSEIKEGKDEITLHMADLSCEPTKTHSVGKEAHCQEAMFQEPSPRNEPRVGNKISKKKHNSSKKTHIVHKLDVNDSRLRAYGINPKKFKNKMKYGVKNKPTL